MAGGVPAVTTLSTAPQQDANGRTQQDTVTGVRTGAGGASSFYARGRSAQRLQWQRESGLVAHFILTSMMTPMLSKNRVVHFPLTLIVYNG
ncbi:hypothetical protein NDU88_000780 [Pleurodeles waltl]|uniref:Uncharacterized protein n=1 Tax=Pleurodeles waltl TaxID=8319 RepID=A0AAV7UQX8_PLEWA|nr:hypothetical protein NDU88_000780 [Pleurodeles waltl]